MYAIGHAIATYLFSGCFVGISMAGGQRGGKLHLKTPSILYCICFRRDLSSEHFRLLFSMHIMLSLHLLTREHKKGARVGDNLNNLSASMSAYICCRRYVLLVITLTITTI